MSEVDADHAQGPMGADRPCDYSGLAVIAVSLAVWPCEESRLYELRPLIDQMYPTEVWPEDTTEPGGRFAWALRREMDRRLREIE